MARALRYAANSEVRKVAHRTENAAGTIGSLYTGLHVTGLTAGQFSSIDAMEHMVDELGPAFAWISTWTTGLYDAKRAAELIKNEKLLGVRMLLDRGTFQKSPQFAGPLIKALGVNSFRCMAVHAKVTVLVDENQAPLAVMRSSMNLNKNLRTEHFDISVCTSLASFYADWFNIAWEESAEGSDNVAIMDAIFRRFDSLQLSDSFSDELVIGDVDLSDLVLEFGDV